MGRKFLMEVEIGVVKRGLGFVPTPNLINEEISGGISTILAEK